MDLGVGAAIVAGAALAGIVGRGIGGIAEDEDDDIGDVQLGNEAEFDSGKKCVFVPHSRKNAKPFLLYGFHLYKDTNMKSKSGTKYYQCSESARGCAAVAHTCIDDDGVEVYVSFCSNGVQHSCEKSFIDLYAVWFALHVYKLCSNRLDSGHKKLHMKIYNKYRKNLASEEDRSRFDRIVAEKYTFQTMKSSMQRRRREVLGPEPTNHSECDFRRYPGMEDLIVGHHKSEEGSNKDVWLFSSEPLLTFLSRCKVTALDCTFKLTPRMWYQTGIILAYASGFWIPCVWFLLPNKELISYEIMCGLLQSELEKRDLNFHQVKYMIVDYELNLRNAVKLFWTWITIIGCYFHRCQCVFRHIQTAGHSIIYRTGEFFREWVKKMCTLDFIPTAYFQEGKDSLEREIETMEIDEEKDAALETWNYHDNTWCKGMPFTKVDWHHEETLSEIASKESDRNLGQELVKAAIEIEESEFITNMKIIPTSNCGAEGVNSAENQDFGNHPNTRKFAMKMIETVEESEGKARMVQHGIKNDRSKIHLKNQSRRLQIQENLQNGLISTSDAMKNLSQTISLGVAIKKKTKAKLAEERIKKVQLEQRQGENDDVDVGQVRGRGRGRPRGRRAAATHPNNIPEDPLPDSEANAGAGRGQRRGRGRGRGAGDNLPVTAGAGRGRGRGRGRGEGRGRGQHVERGIYIYP